MNEAITNKLIACQEVLSTTLESSADDLMMTLTGVNTRVALSGFLKDFMSIFFVVKLLVYVYFLMSIHLIRTEAILVICI